MGGCMTRQQKQELHEYCKARVQRRTRLQSNLKYKLREAALEELEKTKKGKAQKIIKGGL
jgi:hypothetical protein